jgi:hypothetical protein
MGDPSRVVTMAEAAEDYGHMVDAYTKALKAELRKRGVTSLRELPADEVAEVNKAIAGLIL